MALDIDNLPTFDKLIKPGTNHMSDVWMNSLATMVQTLQSYLTQNGIRLPQLTQTQIDQLQNVENGTIIYNSTTNKGQIRENGAWVNFP